MNTFAISSATGKIVRVRDCADKSTKQKYPKGTFKCIDCSEHVIPRRGDKRIWHFAHYSDQHKGKCPHKNGGETLAHYEAKHWIAENLHRCAFAIEQCPTCNRKKYFVGKKGGVQLQKCVAEVEKRVPGTHPKFTRVADVLCIDPKTYKAVAAIEVFHTHETELDKFRECEALGVTVLEVTTEEIQRAKDRHHFWGKKDGELLLTNMDTTTMRKNVECVDCALLHEFRDEQQVAIKFYEFVEDKSWQLIEARCMREKKIQQRKQMVSKGIHEAHAKIQEAEFIARQKKIKYSGKCVGKCKQCSGWMFEGQDLVEVSGETMPEVEWDKLFENDPPKFQKRYTWKKDGRDMYNNIKVHAQCAMECPCCNQHAFVHNLARYGMCYDCCMSFKGSEHHIENALLEHWARQSNRVNTSHSTKGSVLIGQ